VESPRLALKAKLAASMAAIPRESMAAIPRETPTNPGPAIAPPVPAEHAPLELPRPKTGTPLSGVPVELPLTASAASGTIEAPHGKENGKDNGKGNGKDDGKDDGKDGDPKAS
jgi:hypothetical protein